FFFSSRRRHTMFSRDWSSDGALPISTSVYLPDRVLPMLPEHISNVLCSLRPDEDKFTFSAIFQIDKQGNVKQYWIGRTVIHSNQIGRASCRERSYTPRVVAR